MKKVSIKFYPNVDRKSSKSGRIPIYMRITKDGKKSECRLLFDLKESQLVSWNSELERLNQKESIINKHLNKIEDNFNNIIALDFDRIVRLNSRQIRNEIVSVKDERKVYDVRLFIWNYLDSEVKPNYEVGTFKNYKKAIRHLDNFLSIKNVNSFTDINFQFANDFKNYLLADKPKLNRKGMSEVSASGIFKKMRKIFNHAIDQELIGDNSFKRIKLSDVSPSKENFPLHEVHKLFELKELNDIEIMHSLTFQFMVLTGCSYIDGQSLSSNNLSIEKGYHRLSYRRNKTEHISTQYLTTSAISILNKLSVFIDTDDFLLPRISNQYFNRSLKIIGVKQGLNQPLNTHLARAIYYQITNELSDIKEITVDRLLGWSGNSKIKSKYGSVSESMLICVMEKLEIFISSVISTAPDKWNFNTTKKLTSSLWSNKSMLN